MINLKKIISLVCLLVLVLGATFFWYQRTQQKNAPTNQDAKEEEKIDLAKQRLEKMSLEEKIGQLFFISHRNTDYEDGFFDTVKTYQPGGFILFQENITTYQDVKELNQKLKMLSKTPLFIGTDQEGGRVQRFKTLEDKKFTSIPPMQTVGSTNDVEVAKEVGVILGSELAPLGINVDFAPVLDINSNPENTVIGNRSFGTDKEQVTNMALSLAKGLKSTGVIPVYKHFPGHGDTYEDSHQDFANIYKSKEELFETELYPFQEAAKEEDVMMMVGHLSLPNILEDETPASLSPTMIRLLREDLGYQGVIITDALDMGALTKHYREEEIIVKALQAGVDILLMPTNFEKAVKTVKEAIEKGELEQAQVETSVLRILRLKEKYHLFDDDQQKKDLEESELEQHENYMKEHFE